MTDFHRAAITTAHALLDQTPALHAVLLQRRYAADLDDADDAFWRVVVPVTLARLGCPDDVRLLLSYSTT